MAAGLVSDLDRLMTKQRANTDTMLRLVDTVAAAVEARAAAAGTAAANPNLDAVLPKLAGRSVPYTSVATQHLLQPGP